MGVDGVSDISAGAGEGVGGMVNGASFTSGSIVRSGASGKNQRKNTVFCSKASPILYFSFHLYVLKTLTCGPDYANRLS